MTKKGLTMAKEKCESTSTPAHQQSLLTVTLTFSPSSLQSPAPLLSQIRSYRLFFDSDTHATEFLNQVTEALSDTINRVALTGHAHWHGSRARREQSLFGDENSILSQVTAARLGTHGDCAGVEHPDAEFTVHHYAFECEVVVEVEGFHLELVDVFEHLDMKIGAVMHEDDMTGEVHDEDDFHLVTHGETGEIVHAGRYLKEYFEETGDFPRGRRKLGFWSGAWNMVKSSVKSLQQIKKIAAEAKAALSAVAKAAYSVASGNFGATASATAEVFNANYDRDNSKAKKEIDIVADIIAPKYKEHYNKDMPDIAEVTCKNCFGMCVGCCECYPLSFPSPRQYLLTRPSFART